MTSTQRVFNLSEWTPVEGARFKLYDKAYVQTGDTVIGVINRVVDLDAVHYFAYVAFYVDGVMHTSSSGVGSHDGANRYESELSAMAAIYSAWCDTAPHQKFPSKK